MIPDDCKFQAVSSTVSYVAFHCWYKIILRAADNTLVGHRLVPWATVWYRALP